MVILLLTLLGIALTITFVGLWLSSTKVHVSNQQIKSYTERGGPTRRNRGVGEPRGINLQAGGRGRGGRYSIPVARRSWASMAMSVNVADALRWRNGKPSSWLGILFILLALFGFCLVTLKTLAFGPGLVVDTSLSDATATAVQKMTTPDPFVGLAGASGSLKRVGQLDHAQYVSNNEYSQWAYSACSAASMTEVINAYGHNYRITDILKVEADIGAITPDLGLVEPAGIDRTVDRFGFKSVWLKNPSLNDVLKVANDGRPVIVNWPPARWAGGHILVVRGGNDQNVFLADSSAYNFQSMSRARFSQLWAGFAVAVVPK